MSRQSNKQPPQSPDDANQLEKQAPGQSNALDEPSNEFPDEMPLLPLRGVVLYPMMYLPITVGQPRSLRLIEELISREQRYFALAASREPEAEEPDPEQIFPIGTVAHIHRLVRAPDGTVRLIIHGSSRIRIDEFLSKDPYLRVKVSPHPDRDADSVTEQALSSAAQDLFAQLASLSPQIPDEMESAVRNVKNSRQLVYLIASSVGLKLEDAQKILETDPLEEKLKQLNAMLKAMIEMREVAQKIQSEAQGEMEKAQRDFYLRKQMEAIQKELGEDNAQAAEINELEERITTAGMTEEAEKEARRELDRMRRMPIQAAEYSVIKTYLDWMTSLPWQQHTDDNLDIEHARQVLDEDHFGLDDIKDRILEFLAVRKLREERKDERAQDDTPRDMIRKEREGVILCFVGPPGVGKTSLGLSIARAMDRQFVRLALGGIRDEAEIRGFRRTYIGSMPGRIIQSLRRIESRNPVFMLDEVDKLGRDFRGDPASALLEVLDPEQNSEFRDHYLDVPFDLSQVFFITTANWLDPIPGPLRDRMEIIQLSSYTADEKVKIAQGYLIPRQIRENSLHRDEISFDDESVFEIIHNYTREAGVRTLERRIGAICRKVATRVAAGNTDAVAIIAGNVSEWLGKPKFVDEMHEWVEITWRCHWPGLDASRRAGAVHRSHRHAGKGQAHPNRPTRRRDEGISHGCPELRTQRRQKLRHRRRLVSGARPAYPCACRGPTKRWSLGRHRYLHRPHLRRNRKMRARRSRHDGRDHAQRSGNAHRRGERKGPGRTPSRHHHRYLT